LAVTRAREREGTFSVSTDQEHKRLRREDSIRKLGQKKTSKTRLQHHVPVSGKRVDIEEKRRKSRLGRGRLWGAVWKLRYKSETNSVVKKNRDRVANRRGREDIHAATATVLSKTEHMREKLVGRDHRGVRARKGIKIKKELQAGSKNSLPGQGTERESLSKEDAGERDNNFSSSKS